MTADQVFQYDVFLSHSAKDKAVVRLLAERLRSDGLEVWFDEWVLKPTFGRGIFSAPQIFTNSTYEYPSSTVRRLIGTFQAAVTIPPG